MVVHVDARQTQLLSMCRSISFKGLYNESSHRNLESTVEDRPRGAIVTMTSNFILPGTAELITFTRFSQQIVWSRNHAQKQVKRRVNSAPSP